MLREWPRHSEPRKRGVVLVMVIGILALLFIIGSTLLTVVRFERQAVLQKQSAREIEAVTRAVQATILQQLRHDIVGNDGVAYNGK